MVAYASAPDDSGRWTVARQQERARLAGTYDYPIGYPVPGSKYVRAYCFECCCAMRVPWQLNPTKRLCDEHSGEHTRPVVCRGGTATLRAVLEDAGMDFDTYTGAAA